MNEKMMSKSKQLCELLGIKSRIEYTYKDWAGVSILNVCRTKEAIIKEVTKDRGVIAPSRVVKVEISRPDFTNPLNFVKLLEKFASVSSKFGNNNMIIVITENLIEDTLDEIIKNLPQSDEIMLKFLKQQCQMAEWGQYV
jgi:hypothetical protein